MTLTSKRKVIIVGSAYPLRGGGISTFNERLAYAFLENGDEVTIYTFSLQYPSLFFPGTTQYSKEEPPEGLNIKIKVNSINPINWIRTGIEINKLKPDLVIIRFWIPFMGPSLGTIARIIRKNKETKVISITDNIIPHEKKLLDRILVKYFVKSVDGFITMSKSVFDDLAMFDSEKPRKLTVHPLYDNFGEIISKEQALDVLGLDVNFKYILFFGFIREYKGLDLLIKSLGKVHTAKHKIKVLVVGEFYVDPEPYKKLIFDTGVEDVVILKSKFVPNTEVLNYFCSATLVVQPYKEATQSGITQVAFHFNKPVITTNVGGLSEIVIDGEVGFVVEPNENQIAIAIERFFDENLEDQFVENIKNHKKNFEWTKMIESIYQLYLI